jgi:subtilisin family serine protease
MTFNQYLQSVDACEPAVEWAENKTIEEVVATCHRGDWLLWLAKKCDIGLQPLTLAKGYCANTVRHLMNDERSIRAVDIAIAFGEGKATREELAAAAAAAYAAAYTAAADVAAAYAAANAADAAAKAAYAAVDAVDYAAVDANRLQTADICRKYTGELIIEKVNQILTQTP